MQICKIGMNDLRSALALCEEVFDEFEGPDYEPKGIETFKHFIRHDNIVERITQGDMVFYGCYDESKLVGVIALRSKQHVSLLFVKKEYHRQGIARKLFQVIVHLCKTYPLEKPFISVNSSPYAVEVYKRLGFIPQKEEQVGDGIRYTPMLYAL